MEQPEQSQPVGGHKSRESTRRESTDEWYERFMREHEAWNRKVEEAIDELKEAAAELKRAWSSR